MFNTYFNRPSFVGIDFTESPTMTEQHHAAEMDINVIVNRALRTGLDPSLIKSFGKFADATTVTDYFEAQRKYREGVEAFEALPSQIRHRFHNSPSELLSFLADENNRAEAEKLGFIDKIAPESPAVVPDTLLDITGTTDTKVVSQ